MSDLFFTVMDTAMCKFTHDIAIIAADCQFDRVLERLETDALVLSKCFPENFMKMNVKGDPIL